MALVRRIGMPENDSEGRAIRRLAKGLPDEYVVFHNFELTTGRGLPYEFDIAVLAPHARLPRRGQRLPGRDSRQQPAVALRKRQRLSQPDSTGQQKDQGAGRPPAAVPAPP